MRDAAPRKNRLVPALIVVAAWLGVALAWTPPTILVQHVTSGSHPVSPSPGVFLYILAGFVPWMVTTPLLLWLGRRFPLSEIDILRPLAIHVLAGFVLVPAVTLTGTLLSVLLLQHGHIAATDIGPIASAATITSFYSVPTYVAVAAIAQALAYFERYRNRERLLARAQLRALQAQINPHFLFNTLNSISALGYRDPARADAALSQLSELIRQSLKERAQEIPIRDEIAFARGYLDLYMLLMPDKLQVDFAVEGGAWNALVPAMLLQPLIENAIVHGVSKRPQGGRISLSARPVRERLEILLANDVPEVPRDSRGTGIGLANVKERLAALYGAAQRLVFEREGGTATVSISLPLRVSSE